MYLTPDRYSVAASWRQSVLLFSSYHLNVAKRLFKNKDTTAISVIYSDEYSEKQDVFLGEYDAHPLPLGKTAKII